MLEQVVIHHSTVVQSKVPHNDHHRPCLSTTSFLSAPSFVLCCKRKYPFASLTDYDYKARHRRLSLWNGFTRTHLSLIMEAWKTHTHWSRPQSLWNKARPLETEVSVPAWPSFQCFLQLECSFWKVILECPKLPWQKSSWWSYSVPSQYTHLRANRQKGSVCQLLYQGKNSVLPTVRLIHRKIKQDRGWKKQ